MLTNIYVYFRLIYLKIILFFERKENGNKCPNCRSNGIENQWCTSCSHFLVYQCQHCTLINHISKQVCSGETPGPYLDELKTDIKLQANGNSDTSSTEEIHSTEESSTSQESREEENSVQLLTDLRQLIGEGHGNHLRGALERIFERNTDTFIEPFLSMPMITKSISTKKI